ncbi:MAG TPA: glycine zipper 2TM domain-containing protein [Solimonas sp.]
MTSRSWSGLLLGLGMALTLSACAPDNPDDVAQTPANPEQPAPVIEPAPPPAEPSPSAITPTPPPPATRAAAPKPKPAPQPVICTECGTVVAITPVKQKGEGSGAGAAIGAVAGGVAGHQVGGGRGKDVATAIGAIAGAMAGHEVEKRARATTTYDVTINMESGGSRVINVVDVGPLAVGSAVRVDGNNIMPR